MKKKKTEAPATAQPEKKKRKQSKLIQRILAAVLTLLLIVLAVLVFVFREQLSDENLRESIYGPDPFETEGEAFAYESGSDQVFAAAGNGLAVASGSAVQLLNSDGETVWKQIVSYGEPAVFACAQRALFCDIGGRAAVSVNMEGESAAVETGGNIISASMNENGWFTLVTEAAGYKGLVRVYNAEQELQYEWWSGSGYVLRAVLSPDNRTMAAVCVDSEGAKLHCFALSSESARSVTQFPQELVFDLCFLDSETVCCISESGLHFTDLDGNEKGSYELGDYYLLDYAFGSEHFVSLFVSAYRSGTGGLLVTLDAKGEVLGYEEVNRNVTSLCASGKQLLVMTGGDITLYGHDLTRQSSREALMTAKKALLRPKGDVLLLSTYAAEQFGF